MGWENGFGHMTKMAAMPIYEPCHEIMVLLVLRKLILQTRMRSHPVDFW